MLAARSRGSDVSKIKTFFSWLAGAILALGAGIAYILGTCRRNDKRRNIDGIRAELDSERESIKREGEQVESERESIESERADIRQERTGINRDRELLRELKRRFKK